MLNICLLFWKSEPHYAYKRYAYRKICRFIINCYSFHSASLNMFKICPSLLVSLRYLKISDLELKVYCNTFLKISDEVITF